MAVSKRTRFEVLRRDELTCRYCRSRDNALTVDHVVPVALGGSDDPSNLVAACKDCNAGKASASPDEAMVAQVEASAVVWAAAIKAAALKRASERAERDAYVREFDEAWCVWHYTSDTERVVDRDDEWLMSVWRFYELGLPIGDLLDGIQIAMRNTRVANRDKWKYTCGVAWRSLDKIQGDAKKMADWGAF